MAAITLINAVPVSKALAVEFHLSQGENTIARISVHAGSQASVPVASSRSNSQPGAPVQAVNEHNTDPVITAQQWQIYAIVNGITTPNVHVTDPNATITAEPGTTGYVLLVRGGR